MGGSGGYIGAGGSNWGGPISLPKKGTPPPADLVDQEIASSLHEAKRVQALIAALRQAKDNDFVLCALNAGQGDCCVMRLPGGQVVVVDCNARGANVNVVGFLQKAGIKKIDLLILTHPDLDHVSGLTSLARSMKIDAVLDGRFRKEDAEGGRAPAYKEYKQALDDLRDGGTRFLERTPVAGDRFELGYATIRFFAPRAAKQAEDANEASLAFKIQAGKRSALFGGDTTVDMWKRVVRSDRQNLKSEILWGSHHGAATGCLPSAVKAISPRLTIISIGENVHGHPDSGAMNTYEKYSKQVKRTDDGSIGTISREGDQWQDIV